jgi:hypothetical protein
MSDEHDEPPHYELAEPFDIDDGSLDGIDPKLAFTLGAQWMQIRQQLDTGRYVEQSVLADNRDRVEKMLNRRGRDFELSEADQGWCVLQVEAM